MIPKAHSALRTGSSRSVSRVAMESESTITTATRSATAPVSARRCKLKVVATQSKETERGAVSCIAWLGRFGSRGERCDLSLFHITLHAVEVLELPHFRHVRRAVPIIRTDFDDEWTSDRLP